MLAKMWVKSSDFNVHQLVIHTLRTHLTSEVFAIAMYRQLAAVHPVYKVAFTAMRFNVVIQIQGYTGILSIAEGLQDPIVVFVPLINKTDKVSQSIKKGLT